MKYVIKLSSFTALIFALLSGAALFWVSQKVQQSEREQRVLQHQIAQEREAIRVLNAEWDYLNRPDRLENLAEDYLKMEPVKADGLVQNVSMIPEPAPIPVPPKGKPVFVSAAPLKAASKPVPVVRPNPPVAPIEKDEESFEQLLNNLEREQQ